MSDLNDLKQRVGHAVERLASARNSQRERQDILFRLLAELDVKFGARREELAYCHTRIADLEKSNKQLGELLETVIQTVEASYVDDANDPIARAAAFAANLVEQCSAPNDADKYAGPAIDTATARDADRDSPKIDRTPANERADNEEPSPHEEGAVEFSETNEDDTTEVLVSPPRPPASSANEEIEADSDMSFEVISAQEYAYEERLDKEITRLPLTVAQAVSAAKRSQIGDDRRWEKRITDALAKVALASESMEDDELNDAEEMPDIPGIENTAEFEIVDVDVKTSIDEEQSFEEEGNASDPDVRALMARLKEATRKSPEQDDGTEDAVEEPDRRRASGTDDSLSR